MAALIGKQAIVIGAGLGGLAAAGAISDYFERVIVFERDPLPSIAQTRPGTPQSPHTHALLGGGKLALESLFPGFTMALTKAGAVSYRAGLDLLAELPGFDPFPQRDVGWDAYAMSRPLIEYVVRQQLSSECFVRERKKFIWNSCQRSNLLTIPAPFRLPSALLYAVPRSLPSAS